MLMTKSSELTDVLFNGQASSPCNNTGIHLLDTRCRITSSDACLFARFALFFEEKPAMCINYNKIITIHYKFAISSATETIVK